MVALTPVTPRSQSPCLLHCSEVWFLDIKSRECRDSPEKRCFFAEKKHIMGWRLLWKVPTAPGSLEQAWGQGTQSVYICHFIYCFYLQEELKQKLKGVFLSPLNMNHSSKTNLTMEISKVRGSSNNPRAKAGEEEGAVGIEHMQCSPARDRLPRRQAQGPFYEDVLPPTLEMFQSKT